MYRHKLIAKDGNTIQWENEQREVLPCENDGFYYYEIADKEREEIHIYPAVNVIAIHTKEIEGEKNDG